MAVPKIEKFVGMEVYATRSKGIGGALRQRLEDFAVEEVLVDGTKAEITPSAKGKIRILKPSAPGNGYLLAVLVKRNWDTFLAVRAIARELGLGVRQIHIAGIKDAKAVTAQFITAEGITTAILSKINLIDIQIRPVGYFRDKISPSVLLGNNFHITVRALGYSKIIGKRIAETLGEINAKGGIPNFFGHQRFGTVRPITHLVGKALIQRNFKKAALTFLAKPSPYEHPESKNARETLTARQDFKEALNFFPKNLVYERLMLKHLAEKPRDFAGAFRRLPRTLLKLFIQAYQAYLFNKFLSRRLKCGLELNRATVGDYVFNVERTGLPIVGTHRIVDAVSLCKVNEALKTGKMRLALPLLGFKQRLSKGFQGEIEKQILKEEEISKENFKVTLIPEISSKGELRAATTPVKNFSVDEITKDCIDTSRNAVKLHFMLLKGSYATVLLREIMKARNPTEAGF